MQKPSFKNSLGMEFVTIPAGEFDMGSSIKGPVHHVKMSAFKIMSTEVTNHQFDAFMRVNRSKHNPEDHMPVLEVKRSDVLAFIEWLSKRDGIKYLLPTEAEWEYAARGGLKGMDYPWGNEWGGEDQGRAAVGRGLGNNLDNFVASKVGSFPPNGYGVFDMCGNAAEMVRERYYDYVSTPQTDPVGPVEEPSSKPYIVRGVGLGLLFPQVWYRDLDFDKDPLNYVGFRLVEL